MKEEYVNAFLTPFVHVWEKELAVKLTLSGAEQAASQYTTTELTALIGLSGQLEGNVVYGFSQDCAKTIAGRMIGQEVVEMDELSLSAIGELANMITGNAATLLANMGAVCEITPPRDHRAQRFQVHYLWRPADPCEVHQRTWAASHPDQHDGKP